MDDNYFITIFGWMHERLGLKSHEEKVYALIYSFSNNGENTCNTSQGTMARICNCGLNTVKRALIDLENKELIKSRDINRDGVKYKEYWVTDAFKDASSKIREKNDKNDKNGTLEENKDAVEIKDYIIKKYNQFYYEYCVNCENIPENINKDIKEKIMEIMNKFTVSEIENILKKYNKYVFENKNRKNNKTKTNDNYIYIINNFESWKCDKESPKSKNRFNNFKQRIYSAADIAELEKNFYA